MMTNRRHVEMTVFDVVHSLVKLVFQPHYPHCIERIKKGHRPAIIPEKLINQNCHAD